MWCGPFHSAANANETTARRHSDRLMAAMWTTGQLNEMPDMPSHSSAHGNAIRTDAKNAARRRSSGGLRGLIASWSTSAGLQWNL